eukprot:gi/632985889/ref/XP_007909933.1/ PREDICTED: lebercilin-like protein [Callorhinchus milii]
MTDQKSLPDNLSERSPSGDKQSSDSNSSASSKNSADSDGSHQRLRDSACSDYSEDFEDRRSALDTQGTERASGGEQPPVSKEEDTKKSKVTCKKAQKKPASKMLQHWPRLGGRGNRPQPGSGRGEDGVTLRLLSARLHKTKELRNEVCELQRELASARVENKMLKQLQYRHMKALVKFEHEQSNLPQLLSRHETEVRMLKELLRRSQEQDRCVSRQLREAEGELWKTRETLHKLKLLCSKANLAERDELTSRIALLSQKLDSEQDRIQDLEKSLSINTKNFNHLLAAERTKTREANELIKKLQSEQRALHQTITEKERQLAAKNIYSNRMLQSIPKVDISPPKQKVDNAIQTEELASPIIPFSPHNVLPNLDKKTIAHEQREAHKETGDEDNEEEARVSRRLRREQENEKEEEAERLKKEYEQAEKRWKEKEEKKLLETVEDKREREEKEKAAQLLKDVIEEEEGEKQTEPEDQRNAVERLPELGTELGESSGLNESFNKGITRLRRRYRFTEQIENLHQGLPVCKMSTYASHACSKRRLSGLEFPELASSFSGYEPSFGKMCGRASEPRHQPGDGTGDKAEKGLLLPPPRQDKKSSLIETLFGSATGLENKPSAPGGGVKTPDTLAHLQMNKQNHTSRIQVPNKNRLNILDPNLLPGRVLDASTEDNENLILQ